MRRETIIIAGISAASTLVGVTAGYGAAVRRLERKYIDIAEVEVKKAKEYYADFYATLNAQKFDTPEEAVRELIGDEEVLVEDEGVEIEVITPGESISRAVDEKVKTDYAGIHKKGPQVAAKTTVVEDDKTKTETTTVVTPDKEVTVEHVEVKGSHSVFDSVLVDGQPFNPDEWDIEAEQANRESGRPYIITDGEYESNDDGLDILQMTYFVYDDTLVDEQDNPVPNSDDLVGDDNLRRFGHGSGDPRTVYVRNDRFNAIYEITKDDGSYGEAKGFGAGDEPAELRHSAVRAGRRLRDE